MKILLAGMLMLIPLLSGCISSSSPERPATSTTVVVPPNARTTVICSDGTHPHCN